MEKEWWGTWDGWDKEDNSLGKPNPKFPGASRELSRHPGSTGCLHTFTSTKWGMEENWRSCFKTTLNSSRDLLLRTSNDKPSSPKEFRSMEVTHCPGLREHFPAAALVWHRSLQLQEQDFWCKLFWMSPFRTSTAGFCQNASHAFKTCACTPEVFFSCTEPATLSWWRAAPGAAFAWLLCPSSFLHSRSPAPAWSC